METKKKKEIKHMLDTKTVKENKIRKIKEIKKEKIGKKIIISIVSILFILIILAITIYFLDAKNNIFDGKIVSLISFGEKTPEEKAVETAIKRFKELGETGLKQEDLEVLKILRKGDYYYYISSPNNSLEIRISDGKIVRENSVLVEK